MEAAKAKANAPKVVVRPTVEMPGKEGVNAVLAKYPKAQPVQNPVETVIWQVDVVDKSQAPNVGTAVEAGKTCGFVQAYYGMEEVKPAFNGKLVAVFAHQGDKVEKGEVLAMVAE